MRFRTLAWGTALLLTISGCASFGKRGALIDDNQAAVSPKSGLVETTPEMVASCGMLGEINSRADDIDKGKRNVSLMAADIGATHLVWTAAEKFDDAPPSQRAFVSAKAYRCD